MKKINGRHRCPPIRRGLFIVALASGCSSPPSVIPALRVVERTLAQEAVRLEQDDTSRDALYVEQARRGLEDAYLADLQQTHDLTPAWVEQATVVYVAAREELLRHEFDLKEQRQTRADNLRLAAETQARTIILIQQQDRLLQSAGLDLWELESRLTERD